MNKKKENSGSSSSPTEKEIKFLRAAWHCFICTLILLLVILFCADLTRPAWSSSSRRTKLHLATVPQIFVGVDTSGLPAQEKAFLDSWASRDRRDIAPMGKLQKEILNVTSYGDLPAGLFGPLKNKYLQQQKKLAAAAAGSRGGGGGLPTMKAKMAAQHKETINTWTVEVKVMREQCNKEWQECKVFASARYSLTRIRFVKK